MSLLIQLRQRIKTVATIKKTTDAMRLIAMSTHSRLRQQKSALSGYKEEIGSLYQRIQQTTSQTTQSDIFTLGEDLVIFVGSQKGLCGNFNSQLFAFVAKTKAISPSTLVITIGKQARDYAKEQQYTLYADYDNFSTTTFAAIAHSVTENILKNRFSKVSVISMQAKSFFAQKPTNSTLIPFSVPEIIIDPSRIPSEACEMETDASFFLEKLWHMYLTINLQELLFESLLAEQAARFLSMDNATRNADNLLNDMKRDYNKLRQAIITRELTDLASSLLI